MFDVLKDLGIKNSFIGKPYDFSPSNSNRLKDAADILNVDANKIYQVVQTHSSNIAIVRENDDVNDEKFNNKDGLITNVKGVTLLIKVADCQGIFLYDSVKKVIGNVHSGWKGTVNKIIINAIDLMCKEYDCQKEDIICCINPSINKCHFEIEDDVFVQFKNSFGSMLDNFLEIGEIIDGHQKYYIDQVNLNKELLKSYGLKDNNIYTTNICTVCSSDKYYSYRGEKTAKRNGCIISL